MTTTFQRRGGMMSRGGKSGSDLPPRQAVAILIDQLVLDSKKQSTPDKDYAEGFLLHDVPSMGLKAEFSVPEDETQAPMPLTRVKVSMPLPKGQETSRRRDIYGLSRPKGAGVAMDRGSMVIFEKAWLDRKTGEIKAHYAHGCASAAQREAELKYVFSDMLVCVRPEDYNNKSGKWVGRVDVLIADRHAAQLVASKGEVAAAVQEMCERSPIGNPGFQLLARKLAAPGASEAEAIEMARDPNTRIGGFSVARRVKVNPDDKESEYRTEGPDELLARFFKDNEDFEALLGDEGWMVEFVPMMAVNQAKSLVPSQAEANGDKPRDNSPIYGIYGEVGPDNRDARNVVQGADGVNYGMVDVGWMPSHVVCERKEATSDVWYSTYQNPMGARLDADCIHDVRTPNTPSYHLAAIAEQAALNVEGKKKHRAAAGLSPDEAPEPEPDAAQSPGMGR
jgi:hypothetical protein